MIGRALHILQLSFNRDSTSCYRPDVLRQPAHLLLADQGPTDTLAKEVNGLSSCEHVDFVTQGLVRSRGCWGSEAKITRIALVLRIAAICQSFAKRFKNNAGYLLIYLAFRVETCAHVLHLFLPQFENPGAHPQSATCPRRPATRNHEALIMPVSPHDGHSVQKATRDSAEKCSETWTSSRRIVPPATPCVKRRPSITHKSP